MGDQFRMTNNQLERLRALLGAKTTPDGRLLRGSPRGAKSHGEDCWCACCIRRLLAAHDRYFQAWSRRALSGEKGMSDIPELTELGMCRVEVSKLTDDNRRLRAENARLRAGVSAERERCAEEVLKCADRALVSWNAAQEIAAAIRSRKGTNSVDEGEKG